MSASRLFNQLITGFTHDHSLTTTVGEVKPYQSVSAGLMAVAPCLHDDVLVDLAQRLAQPITVVHAAQGDGHQALILSVAQLPTRDELRRWSDALRIDLGVRAHAQPWRWPSLALCDMDSTLITMEVIDELAKEAGVGAQVAAITDAAMRGELDFNASLTQRVATLRDLPLSVIERVRDRLQFNPGVASFATMARAQACRLAVVSGGFMPFALWVKEQLQFDVARANTLEIVERTLSGKVVGEIVNAQVKARTLDELSQHFAVTNENVMAVGDGANDLMMLQASGFGVAFRAKPTLRAVADLALDVSDMRALNVLFKQN